MRIDMERDQVVKASFFAKHEKQLEFLINAFARIVGKNNINYLVPKYHHKSRLFILNMDIKIPETLLKSVFSARYQPSSDKGES
ncbi:MAG: hypothetical protein ACFFDT_24545 [Candidatus Hodarchaeota archaeon]